MNNPLDNFKNPFDIDGEYAKRILNTDKILDASKILNTDFLKQNIEKPTEEETFFESQGRTLLRRYYQALNYKKRGIGSYGMDCNACCVMYFLQSYGLIPPFINRKQFEYAFTPLFPNFTKHIMVEEIKKYSKSKSIELEEEESGIFSSLNSPKKYNLPLKTDILDGIFPNTEYFCRGISDPRYLDNAIFPNGAYSSYDKLIKICDNFADLSSQAGFKFLENYKSKYYHLNYMGLKNKYDDLANGIKDTEYFDRNVIFVGLHAYSKPPYPSHYCLIVNNPKKVVLDNQEFWSYPADDSLQGQTQVYVPLSPLQNLDEAMKKIEKMKGLHYLIEPNNAFGV